MDLDTTLSEMFREVYNKGETHHSTRKVFPRECFTEICNVLSMLSELDECRNVACDVKLHRGTVSVQFTYFNDVGELPFEKKVREQFLASEGEL